MLRLFVLVLMLLAGLAVVPLARASQACCEQGCDHAMPACVAVCALCASAAALPAPEPVAPAAAPTELGPSTTAPAFDDWIDEIWNPPD